MFQKNFETNQSDTQKSLKLVELSNEIETILKEKNELQSAKDKELIELEEKWSKDYKKVKNEKDDLFMSKFLFSNIYIVRAFLEILQPALVHLSVVMPLTKLTLTY